MRNLSELKIDEGKRPVTAGRLVRRRPPTEKQIQAFQSRFCVELPDEYLMFLRFSNGGHPQVGTFAPREMGDRGPWEVNIFYHLEDDETNLLGLWTNTSALQKVLSLKVVPIADDPCGDQIVLSFDTNPPNVKLYIHDEMRLIDVADSFSDFIDMLSEDSDII